MKYKKKDFESALVNYNDFIASVWHMKEYLSESIVDCDKASSDILHFLELEELTDKKKISYSNQLTKIRRKRREYKDLEEISKPIINFLESDLGGKFRTQLNQMISNVRKIENEQMKRAYAPKVVGRTTK